MKEFILEERRIVIAEYGFMMGCFDFLTGGKICDINIFTYPGLSNQEYIDGLVKKAMSTVEANPKWIEILNNLPTINL